MHGQHIKAGEWLQAGQDVADAFGWGFKALQDLVVGVATELPKFLGIGNEWTVKGTSAGAKFAQGFGYQAALNMWDWVTASWDTLKLELGKDIASYFYNVSRDASTIFNSGFSADGIAKTLEQKISGIDWTGLGLNAMTQMFFGNLPISSMISDAVIGAFTAAFQKLASAGVPGAQFVLDKLLPKISPQSLETITKDRKELHDQILGMVTDINNLSQTAGYEGSISYTDITKKIPSMSLDSLQDMLREFTDVKKKLDDSINTSYRTGDAIKQDPDIIKFLNQYSDAVDSIFDKYNKNNPLSGILPDTSNVTDTNDALSNFKETMNAINQLYKDGTLNQTDYQEQLKNLTNGLNGASNANNSFKTSTKSAMDSVDSGKNALNDTATKPGSAAVKATDTGKNAVKAVSGGFKSGDEGTGTYTGHHFTVARDIADRQAKLLGAYAKKSKYQNDPYRKDAASRLSEVTAAQNALKSLEEQYRSSWENQTKTQTPAMSLSSYQDQVNEYYKQLTGKSTAKEVMKGPVRGTSKTPEVMKGPVGDSEIMKTPIKNVQEVTNQPIKDVMKTSGLNTGVVAMKAVEPGKQALEVTKGIITLNTLKYDVQAPEVTSTVSRIKDWWTQVTTGLDLTIPVNTSYNNSPTLPTSPAPAGGGNQTVVVQAPIRQTDDRPTTVNITINGYQKSPQQLADEIAKIWNTKTRGSRI